MKTFRKVYQEDGSYYFEEEHGQTSWAAEHYEHASVDEVEAGFTNNWFAKLMRKWGRERIIYDPITKKPYMYRYYILWCDHNDTRRGKFNIFIHNIVASDHYALHDHPWDYASLILWGKYREIFNNTTVVRNTGHFRVAKAEKLHRIVIIDKPVWTLFAHGPKIREWGFIDKVGRWVHYPEFLASLSQDKRNR